MKAAEVIKAAIGAAHAILVHDQSGSGTSFREAERAAKTVLSAWVTIQSNPRQAINDLDKFALLVEEENDKRGVFRILREIEQNYNTRDVEMLNGSQ